MGDGGTDREVILCRQRTAVEVRNTAEKTWYHVHTAISVKKTLPAEQAVA